MDNRDSRSVPATFTAGLAPLSRRGFLRASVLTGAALTSGCATLFVSREPPEELIHDHLSPEEARVATRFTEVLLPTEEHGLPSSTTVVPTVGNLDGMVGQMSPQTRELFALAFWVLEYRPMASFRFSRFTKLDDRRAQEYLVALQEGTFFERGLVTGLKSLVALNYWRDERTWPALDYHGPVTEQWGVRPLGNTPPPRTAQGRG